MRGVARGVDPSEHRDVWVFVEHRAGRAHPVSWQLVGAARRLADALGEEAAAIVLGHGVEALADEAFARGADRVYLVDDPLLEPYRAWPHARTFGRLIETHRPGIVLLGATAVGRELAALVATEVQAGLTADVTQLDVDRERRLLEATRPTFGGKQLATIVCERWRPQMATVRPGVFPLPEPRPGRRGVPVREQPGPVAPALLVEVLAVLPREERSDLERARVVVAGGRGLGEARNVALLRELAEVLGGVVAGSRPAVEAGWLPREAQVGQTGKVVRPRLYVAVGISGAVQHLVGMEDAEVVVAVNRDPEAPIFEVADYGVVGDLRQVVPALTEELRLRLRSRGVPGGRGGEPLRTGSR